MPLETAAAAPKADVDPLVYMPPALRLVLYCLSCTVSVTCCAMLLGMVQGMMPPHTSSSTLFPFHLHSLPLHSPMHQPC